MKLNDIKFLPKTNAFGDVYAKATGMPFVGEMMVAAAGNGGEPTPPTPSVVESVTINGTQDDVDFYTIFGILTFSQDFMTENCDPTYESSTVFTLTIKDSNNTTICECEPTIFDDCDRNQYDTFYFGEGTLPTLPESGNYSIVVSTAYGLEDPVVVYEGTGTWTYQDPQI